MIRPAMLGRDGFRAQPTPTKAQSKKDMPSPFAIRHAASIGHEMVRTYNGLHSGDVSHPFDSLSNEEKVALKERVTYYLLNPDAETPETADLIFKVAVLTLFRGAV